MTTRREADPRSWEVIECPECNVGCGAYVIDLADSSAECGHCGRHFAIKFDMVYCEGEIEGGYAQGGKKR